MMDNSERGVLLTTGQKVFVLATLSYATLCVTIFVDAAAIVGVGVQLPRWLGLVALTVVGPALFLADGVAGWDWFVGFLVAIAACLGLAWVAWRLSPDSELFLAPLLMSASIWAVAGWVVLVMTW